jgi:hypothetical protein
MELGQTLKQEALRSPQRVIINRPGGPEIRLPLIPRERTQVGHRAKSETCEEETSDQTTRRPEGSEFFKCQLRQFLTRKLVSSSRRHPQASPGTAERNHWSVTKASPPSNPRGGK